MFGEKPTEAQKAILIKFGRNPEIFSKQTAWLEISKIKGAYHKLPRWKQSEWRIKQKRESNRLKKYHLI